MSEPFMGEIRAFGFQFAPRDWALCTGQVLDIAQHQALYALLGYTYGVQSQVSFSLPDLQGRMPMGQGQGQSLSTRLMGEKLGMERTYLTTQQVPVTAHTHPANFTPGSISATSTFSVDTSDEGSLPAPASGSWLAKSPASGQFAAKIFTPAGTTPTSSVNLSGITTTVDGSGGAISVGNNTPANPSRDVELMNPFLVINYSIALMGIFPSRN